MSPEKFNEQILRLADVFGSKHYTTPRLRVILGSLKHYNDSVFERAVNLLIASKRVAPLVLEIAEACDKILADDKQRAREDAPTVGMFGQLQDAARKGTSDREFVTLCLKTVESRMTGKFTDKEFKEACDSIDRLANQINPSGVRRDLELKSGHWELAAKRV